MWAKTCEGFLVDGYERAPSTLAMLAARRWFFRFTALHFIVTALTGVALYVRPGGARPGWYSEQTKEILVMIHNGEWLGYVVLGRPFVSGIIVGSALAVVLIRFATRALWAPRKLTERLVPQGGREG
jgi:hypothetical protein